MRRAPGPIGVVFAASLAVVIMLLGPLLLFNPWFTSSLQARHDVAGAFGTTQAAVDRVTGELLRDIYLDGPFTASFEGDEPLLDAAERSHMADVAHLAQVLVGITVVAVVLVAATGTALRAERRRRGRLMVLAAGSVGTLAVVLAAAFGLAFDATFRLFHQVFFPGGNWEFATGSNLITLFPEPFWFDAALVVTVAGLRRWRPGETDASSGLL